MKMQTMSKIRLLLSRIADYVRKIRDEEIENVKRYCEQYN